jgi:carbon monoxide dehydrogenase subunit G|tara:strand:- start:237 stop:881 length:645 start_codon:yes stop_codon:yes gene_type:complete
MDFDNSFDVPLPPDQAWATLMDIERIAPCMPGAELTEMVDDKKFKGKVSVRLGPVALTFQGTASFEDVDNEAHKANVKAQGADAKGRGGANATVAFHLEPSDTGSTVKIHTDLQLSGSVAQYGRGAGMIQDLASQIIGQFAKNLAAQIEADQPATTATENGANADIATTDSAQAAKPAAPNPQAAAPAQVGGMAFKVMWNQIVRSIKSLFGEKS